MRKNNNLLVIGSAGQLGRAIKDAYDSNEELKRTFGLIETDVVPGYQYLDATNKKELESFINANSVFAILNCAAYTNVGKAEDDFAACSKLNSSMLHSISSAISSSNSFPLLMHVSTDYVYSGTGCRPYRENEAGNPCGTYGFTKLKGEEAINPSIRSVIFRTSWLYYYGNASFPYKIISKLNDSSLERIPVVINQIGTPTYAGDLANAMLTLAKYDFMRTTLLGKNIFNFSNIGACSWYDFAKEIESLTTKTSKVVPIEIEDRIRPSYSVMSKSKIMERFPDIEIPYWKDSLKKFIENYR